MTKPDLRLRLIEQIDYRSFLIKVAMRGEEIRILIYPPGAMLATRIIVDRIANHAAALTAAKSLVDQLVAEAAAIDLEDFFEQ